MWPAARAATKRAICNGCHWIPWSTIECPADILRHEEKLRPRAGGSGPLSESHERLLRLGTKGCNGSGTATRSPAMSGGSTIYTGRSRLNGRCELYSGRSYWKGGSL